MTFRHPAVVAKAAATADQISGGRVEVGMGAGWMDAEHERFGLPFPPMEERVRKLAADSRPSTASSVATRCASSDRGRR